MNDITGGQFLIAAWAIRHLRVRHLDETRRNIGLMRRTNWPFCDALRPDSPRTFAASVRWIGFSVLFRCVARGTCAAQNQCGGKISGSNGACSRRGGLLQARVAVSIE